MNRDAIRGLIVGKIETAFDEARAQATDRNVLPPEDQDVSEQKRLRQLLDVRVAEWDRAIETAIKEGKSHLLLARCGGKVWFECSERFKRGSWRNSSQGAKWSPLLDGLDLDYKFHGLRRLRLSIIPVLSSWLEENYWHAVWLEIYKKDDQGISWKPGEISSVREINETLMLTWI